MFLDLDFFQIQIRLNALTNLAIKPIPNDLETDDEMLETNGPSGVANNPKEPDDQAPNLPTNP